MNNDTPQESLRLSSEPYVIALDNENSDLITPVLDQHGDLKIAKKRKWDFPTIEVTSYKDGMVQLKATSDKESYIISVLVEKDKLHISCSCNQPVEKLCRHAYATLQKYPIIIMAILTLNNTTKTDWQQLRKTISTCSKLRKSVQV